MLDVVKPDDLQAIIVRLMLAAQQGDVAAARVALAYTVGKPAPTVDPDALDLHEWQHWQQMPVPPELLAGLLGPLQVPVACTLARTILPLLLDAFRQTPFNGSIGLASSVAHQTAAWIQPCGRHLWLSVQTRPPSFGFTSGLPWARDNGADAVMSPASGALPLLCGPGLPAV